MESMFTETNESYREIVFLDFPQPWGKIEKYQCECSGGTHCFIVRTNLMSPHISYPTQEEARKELGKLKGCYEGEHSWMYSKESLGRVRSWCGVCKMENDLSTLED